MTALKEMLSPAANILGFPFTRVSERPWKHCSVLLLDSSVSHCRALTSNVWVTKTEMGLRCK